MARPTKQLEDIEFNGWDILDSNILWGSETYCADKLGINIDTLAARIKEKYGMSFPEYKHKKREVLRINIAKKQYDQAMQGSVPLLIWLGKNELGQADKQEVDNKSSDGSMTPQITINNDLSHLSDDDLIKIKEILSKNENTNA